MEVRVLAHERRLWSGRSTRFWTGFELDSHDPGGGSPPKEENDSHNLRRDLDDQAALGLICPCQPKSKSQDNPETTERGLPLARDIRATWPGFARRRNDRKHAFCPLLPPCMLSGTLTSQSRRSPPAAGRTPPPTRQFPGYVRMNPSAGRQPGSEGKPGARCRASSLM